MENFKKIESIPTPSDSSDQSQSDSEEAPVEEPEHENAGRERGHDEHGLDPYQAAAWEVLTWLSRADRSDDPEDLESRHDELSRQLADIYGKEEVFARGLESKESFGVVLDALEGLTDNKLAIDDVLGVNAASFAGKFIKKHMNKIEESISEASQTGSFEDGYNTGSVFRAINSLIGAGKKYDIADFRDSGQDFLTRNLDIIEEAILTVMHRSPREGVKLNNRTNRYGYVLRALYQNVFVPDIKCRVAKLTAMVITGQQKEFGDTIDEVAKIGDNLIDQLTYRGSRNLNLDFPPDLFLHDVLRTYGISPNDFYHAWGRSIRNQPVEVFRRITRSNLETMRDVEYTTRRDISFPFGAVNYLNKNFGIYDFSRYPTPMLTKQFEAEFTDEVARPYGLVINPRDDHNGAFYENFFAYRNLFDELQRQEEPWLLRVIEIENKREAGRRILRLVENYGPAKFGIIGGHGSKNSIQFGRGRGMYGLRTEDLNGRGIQRGGKMLFEENATIILNSCSTGSQEGIGQKMSETFGLTFIGPDKPTALKSIRVEICEGKAQLHADYLDSNASRTYGKEETTAYSDSTLPQNRKTK